MPFTLPTLSSPTNPSIDPSGGSGGFLSSYSSAALNTSPPDFGGLAPGSYATNRNNLEAGLGAGVPIWVMSGFEGFGGDSPELTFAQRVGLGQGSNLMQIILASVIAGVLVVILRKTNFI